MDINGIIMVLSNKAAPRKILRQNVWQAGRWLNRFTSEDLPEVVSVQNAVLLRRIMFDKVPEINGRCLFTGFYSGLPAILAFCAVNR